MEEKYELQKTLEDIKSNQISDLVPEDKVNEMIDECNKQINGRNGPNTKTKYIAKDLI